MGKTDDNLNFCELDEGDITVLLRYINIVVNYVGTLGVNWYEVWRSRDGIISEVLHYH